VTQSDLNGVAKRILVFRIGQLGDTLIALPALRAIRDAFPLAHISLLGNADQRGIQVTPQQILPANGLIDDWICYPSRQPGAFSARLQMLRKLRRGRYQTLVYLAPRRRIVSDVRRDLLFFRLAGIRSVIGQKGFAPLPSKSGGALPVVENEADHLLQRLSLSGISVPSPGTAKFPLDLSEDEYRVASLWWHKNIPGAAADRAVGFGPGSNWPAKVWPEERFRDVGHELIKATGIFPIIFGGPEDRKLGERLLSSWGLGANAAGQLPVRPAAAALSHCRLYVGNDTGTMHLAAAVGCCCVAITPALDWPGHWYPYGSGHTVLRRSVPCEGCLLQVCAQEGMRCLREISVAEVVQVCSKKLETFFADRGSYPNDQPATKSRRAI
jgi:ADP-heptose:LPS heptosyltransferase